MNKKTDLNCRDRKDCPDGDCYNCYVSPMGAKYKETVEKVKKALSTGCKYVVGDKVIDTGCLATTLKQIWQDKISAGELRAIGCTIPENIPDVATVPRMALTFDKVSVMLDEAKEDTVNVQIPLNIDASFTWKEMTFTIEPSDWENVIKTLKKLKAEGKIDLNEDK